MNKLIKTNVFNKKLAKFPARSSKKRHLIKNHNLRVKQYQL